jgi:hypothetical protein
MKSNSRREQLPTENTTREELPLELVAATAIHFLDKPCSDARSRDLKDAAEMAIRFLRICAKNIEDDQRQEQARHKILEEFKRRGWEYSDVVPYNQGIKFITGQKRLDRAQEHYKVFRKSNMPLGKPLTSSELTAVLKKDRKEGFIAQGLLFQRSMFELMRSCRKRHEKTQEI